MAKSPPKYKRRGEEVTQKGKIATKTLRMGCNSPISLPMSLTVTSRIVMVKIVEFYPIVPSQNKNGQERLMKSFYSNIVCIQ